MMADETKNDGRSATGEPSRKRRGRPRTKRGPLLTISDFNQLIIDVANRKVPQKMGNDGLPPITLLERNVLSLGTGTPQNRLASRSFIDLAKVAMREEELRRR